MISLKIIRATPHRCKNHSGFNLIPWLLFLRINGGIYMTQPGSNRVRTRNTRAFSNLETDEGQNLMIGFGNKNIASFDSVSGWTKISAKASTPAASTTHLTGSGSVSFTATATGAEAVGIYKDVVLDLTGFDTSDTIEFNVYLPALTGITNVVVKVGTDASNYMGFTWLVADLSTGWNYLTLQMNDGVPVGTGWDQAAIIYVSFEVTTSGAQTVTGILLDMLKITKTSNVDINVSATGLAKETTLSAINTKTPALGTAVMASSSPITLATNDTQLGAIGSVADADGNIHGQLYHIANSNSAIETAAGRLTSSAAGLAPGVLATTAFVAGGQYNLVAPTFTDAQTGAQQLDASGNKKVNVAAQSLTALKVSATDAANASTNPIYVSGYGVSETWAKTTRAWASPTTAYAQASVTDPFNLVGKSLISLTLKGDAGETGVGCTGYTVGIAWSDESAGTYTSEAEFFEAFTNKGLLVTTSPVLLTKQNQYMKIWLKAVGGNSNGAISIDVNVA